MKICIPIREKTASAAHLQVKKAQKQADFVEIWLDKINAYDAAQLIKNCKKPVVAVCRASREKGAFIGSEQERIDVLMKAVEAGAAYVDCGIHTSPSLIKKLKAMMKRRRAKLIISEHFWKGTPPLEQLEKKVEAAKRLGADIVKIATTVKSWSDNVVLFELMRRTVERGQKIIVVGMGERGKISRFGCALLGGYLTYVAFNENSKTAPGQLTLAEFKALEL